MTARLPYAAALERIAEYIDSFGEALYGPHQEPVESVRVSLRERRDYWHALGSRIRRRMVRENARVIQP